MNRITNCFHTATEPLFTWSQWNFCSVTITRYTTFPNERQIGKLTFWTTLVFFKLTNNFKFDCYEFILVIIHTDYNILAYFNFSAFFKNSLQKTSCIRKIWWSLTRISVGLCFGPRISVGLCYDTQTLFGTGVSPFQVKFVNFNISEQRFYNISL